MRTLICLFIGILPMWSQTTYPYAIKTLAGANPTGDNGPAKSALLEFPSAITVDKAGNVYIADGNLNGIRKVAPDGTITTIATIYALGLAVDAAGTVYAVDGLDAVYKVTASGAISLFAGGNFGSTGDGGQATAAALNAPSGITLDSAGNVYIADTYNCKIRMVNPGGVIQTVVGTGVCGRTGDNGIAVKAQIAYPTAVVFDASGNMYIGEYGRIRKVATDQTVSTVAGLGNTVADGPATASGVGANIGLAVDTAGNLYIADADNNRVREVVGLNIKTIAGTSTMGFTGDGGAASGAQLNYPTGLALDAKGNLYIADQLNDRIRLVNTVLAISTFAGANHYAGDNSSALSALLHLPQHAITDAAGNLYISDTANSRIRKVTSAGTITTIAGNGICAYTGDNGPAVAASLCFPGQIALDSTNRLYIADSANSVIRRIETNGNITTFAGTGAFGNGGDNGPATAAQFEAPIGLAFDAAGNLYVADEFTNRVRKIGLDGKITAFAGNGNPTFAGDGGIATAAGLYTPGQLAINGSDVYIADQYNVRVRKVSGGIITTVAGTSTCCNTGAPANGTYIGVPSGIAVDSSGILYISQGGSNIISRVTPDNKISIVAGTGAAGLSGDGGLASVAGISAPGGLSIDSAGDLYLADRYNNRVRKLILDSPTQMTAGSGDQQTAPPGTVLPTPLTVQVSFRAGVGVRGLAVAFAVTSGAATLSAASTLTDNTGLAGVGVTLGSAAGPVIVTATLAGLPPVQFHLTAANAVPLPTITAGGIVGAGGSIPAVGQISTGGLATIFGSNFAPAGTSRQVQASDLTNGILPTSLAGVCVNVGGQPAYLTYVSPTQINIQIPNVPPAGTASVQVISNCGTASALQSTPLTVGTQPATPEFLFWVKNASGQNPVIAINAVTYAYVGAAGLIPGLTFTPAKPGDILTIYGVSFGPTNPAIAAGASSAVVAQTTNAPSVTLGGTPLAASNLLYAGISPGTAGLYQLNIQVPAGLADGDYPIVLTLGGFSTPTGAYLTIKN